MREDVDPLRESEGMEPPRGRAGKPPLFLEVMAQDEMRGGSWQGGRAPDRVRGARADRRADTRAAVRTDSRLPCPGRARPAHPAYLHAAAQGAGMFPPPRLVQAVQPLLAAARIARTWRKRSIPVGPDGMATVTGAHCAARMAFRASGQFGLEVSRYSSVACAIPSRIPP
jgi:hypothetical protein